MRGYNLVWMGEVDPGHAWLQRAWTTYDPARDAALRDMVGSDPLAEALIWDAVTAWYRGYPDQAVAMEARAVAWARELDHPISLCHALSAGSSVLQECGDYPAALPLADEAAQLAAREHFPFWEASAAIHRGIAIGHLDDPARGIALIEQGLEAWRMMGVTAFESWYTCDLAILDRLLGETKRGLRRCERAIAEAEVSGTGLAELRAKVTRAKLLIDGEPAPAIEALQGAIDATHRMGARWLELQAATELAILLQRTGRRAEARNVLEPVVAWFTEGFDLLHLARARKVLAGL